MPLTGKDRRMEQAFTDRYGSEGKSVYYATLNKRINEGRPINTSESRRLAKKRKHHKARGHHRKV